MSHKPLACAAIPAVTDLDIEERREPFYKQRVALPSRVLPEHLDNKPFIILPSPQRQRELIDYMKVE